jgi:hypothetical protein
MVIKLVPPSHRVHGSCANYNGQRNNYQEYYAFASDRHGITPTV